MTEIYYNTNREDGHRLIESKRKVSKQELAILECFKRNPHMFMAPHEVQAECLPGTPLTSIRRGITNLTDDGHLEKTDYMVKGSFGKNVHTWRLKSKIGQMQFDF